MKCEGCQVASELICHGETVPRLCELAASRTDYRRLLERRAKEGARPDSRPMIFGEVERLKIVGRCQFARIPSCSCPNVECSEGGKRPGRKVSIVDCEACLSKR